MQSDVAIIGAGPAGLLLAHLLHRAGVDAVVLERRSPDYVLSRIRAGILESSSVELLEQVGLGERIRREGYEHRGIYLQWPGERHHLDFVELTGHPVWVYGQTQLTKDLMAARRADEQRAYYEVEDVTLHDVESDSPRVTFVDAHGQPQEIVCRAVAGCDGFHGPSRAAIPGALQQTWERTYPYSWLGVLADVPPSTDDLIYAWHPDGFALHSMRSTTISRLYLQVDPHEDIANWPDDRIWDALAERLGHGQGGWRLQRGPVLEKSILPMRSFVTTPMRHGRVFLAGDAAHIVPPTGAKGLNLAIADVALLSDALISWLRDGARELVDGYSETALRRVWRCTHFSWWMTSMLHVSGDPFDAQLQQSQLRWVTSSRAAATGLAENYAGLPIGF